MSQIDIILIQLIIAAIVFFSIKYLYDSIIGLSDKDVRKMVLAATIGIVVLGALLVWFTRKKK